MENRHNYWEIESKRTFPDGKHLYTERYVTWDTTVIELMKELTDPDWPVDAITIRFYNAMTGRTSVILKYIDRTE